MRCPQQAAGSRSASEVGTGVGHTWCPSTLPSSAHLVRAGAGGRRPGAPCLAHPGGGDRWWEEARARGALVSKKVDGQHVLDRAPFDPQAEEYQIVAPIAGG